MIIVNKLKNNRYVQLFFMSVVILTAMSLVMDYADFLDEHSENIVKLGINPQCNSARAICSASIMHKGNFQRISFSIKKNNCTYLLFFSLFTIII